MIPLCWGLVSGPPSYRLQEPFSSNTLASCSISGGLLVLSQVQWALSRMHSITPVCIHGLWWEWYGMYQSVWAGSCTAVESWSSLHVTSIYIQECKK